MSLHRKLIAHLARDGQACPERAIDEIVLETQRLRENIVARLSLMPTDYIISLIRLDAAWQRKYTALETKSKAEESAMGADYRNLLAQSDENETAVGDLSKRMKAMREWMAACPEHFPE